jgi:hypothetical protein
MHEQQDRPRQPFHELRGDVNIFIGLCQAFAKPLWIWWTKPGTGGEMVFGDRLSVIGWLILPIWPMCLMPCDPSPMYVFWGLTTLLMLIHRVRHASLRRKGQWPHSMFMGYTWLAWPWQDKFHDVAEVALTMGIGFMLAGPWPVLGWYLVWASIAMIVDLAYASEAQRSTLRRLHDARREQLWLAQKMEELERE